MIRASTVVVDFEPTLIMVTPSYFLAILDEMERQGVDPKQTSLRVGIFGAEPWTDELLAEVELALAGRDGTTKGAA